MVSFVFIWEYTILATPAKTQNSNHINVDQFASTASYTKPFKIYSLPSTIKTGVSYTNNIADAEILRKIFIKNAQNAKIEAFLQKLKQTGAGYEIKKDGIIPSFFVIYYVVINST